MAFDGGRGVSTFRRLALWVGLWFFAVLAITSVGGALMGAERASGMFGSTPGRLLWVLFATLLLMVLFCKPVSRSPALLALHAAPVLILAGAFLGSAPGHRVADALLHRQKASEGALLIFEGRAENLLVEPDRGVPLGRLPFSVRLDRFTVERYPPGPSDPQGEPPVRSYRSDVTVLLDGRPVQSASIEVNRPLHFGGYHLYQSSYGTLPATYTVLTVVSDSGLSLVYAGFILLGAGVFWWGWGEPILAHLRRRRGNGA